MAETQEDLIKAEVAAAMDVQRALQELQDELVQADPRFKMFIDRQTVALKQIDETWQMVRDQMEQHSIKSIKGDWGTITLKERLTFAIDKDALPEEFWKLAPDTKKIGEVFKLEGEAPEGATPRYTRFLDKRLK